MCFNHEVVPDYLRTKPEPEVEDKVNIVVQKSAAMQADMAQVRTLSLFFEKNTLSSYITICFNRSSTTTYITFFFF